MGAQANFTFLFFMEQLFFVPLKQLFLATPADDSFTRIVAQLSENLEKKHYWVMCFNNNNNINNNIQLLILLRLQSITAVAHDIQKYN